MGKTKTPIKAIVFDFDGVFVRDSDAVFKKEAWNKVLLPYGERGRLLFEEAKGLFGYGKAGGRKEILQHVFSRISESWSGINDLVDRALGEFDEYVQTKILEVGLVSGSVKTLKYFFDNGLPLYLNSGTETSALKLSVRNLKIEGFFKGVFGSSKSKVDNLLFILDQEGVQPAEIAMVGDGDSDFVAAREVGCRFIGLANRWNGWEERGEWDLPFSFVTSLEELMDFL